MHENETRIGDLEKQLAEIKQSLQNTEYEKEQQITSLKADLEKVFLLFLLLNFKKAKYQRIKYYNQKNYSTM